MLKQDSGDLPDGGRAIIFTTPCGYEVTVIRTTGGKLRITGHNMYGELVTDFLHNHQHLLSQEGSRELVEHLGKLYEKPQ